MIFLTKSFRINYTNNRGDLMLFKRFSIFRLIGIAIGLVVLLFFVFKASITGSII